jgi:HAD superfamily hydrolase (TIGR01458 family)
LKRLGFYFLWFNFLNILELEKSQNLFKLILIFLKFSPIKKMFKGVCIDINGVIYSGNQLCTKNILKSFQKLKESKKKYLFVTNTSRDSKSLILKKLNELGIETDSKSIYTSPEATKNLLNTLKLKNPYFLTHENLKEEFTEFFSLEVSKNEKDYDCLVLGNLNSTTTFEEINFGFRVLKHLQKTSTPILIGMGSNKYFKDDDNKLTMSTSGLIECFKNSLSNSKPDIQLYVAGKPNESIFKGAASQMGLDVKDCVMIGDDWEGDVKGSLSAGFACGVLVKTGKYNVGDEEKLKNVNSSKIFENFDEAINFILE